MGRCLAMGWGSVITDKFTDNDNVPVVLHFSQCEFNLTNFKPPIR